MDRLDKKILMVYGKNARISNAKLAKLVGSSREVITYRIQKMEKLGIIKNYSAYFMNRLLGIENYTLLIKLQNLEKNTEKKILDKIKNIGYVKILFNCRGDYDISLVLGAKSRLHLTKLYEDITKICGNHLREIDLELDIRPLKVETYNFLLDGFDFDFKKKWKSFVEIDNKDKEIIKVLSEKAKLSILDISKKVKLTPETASKRLNKMINDGAITSIQADIDYKKLGYDTYLVSLKINDYGFEKEGSFRELFTKNKNIVFARRVLGRWDLLLNIISKGHDDFLETMDKIRSYLGKDLVEYSFSLIREELKRKPFVGKL